MKKLSKKKSRKPERVISFEWMNTITKIKKASYLLICFLIAGCARSGNQAFLDEFEDFVVEVESGHSEFFQEDWDEYDDYYSVYSTPPNDMRLDEQNKFDSLVFRYDSLRSSFVEPKLNLKLYMDNSASTKGYLTGGSFSNIISTISNETYISSVEYFFINVKIEPLNDNVSDFRSRIGQKKHVNVQAPKSDLNSVIPEVFNDNRINDISIMIGDGIYSVDKDLEKNAVASNLFNQAKETKKKITQFIQTNRETECIIYKFQGEFDGTYYDYKDNKHKINQPRPFYVWVIGNSRSLKKFKSNIKFIKPPTNEAHLFISDNKEYEFSVIQNGLMDPNRSGNFLSSSIGGAKKETRQGYWKDKFYFDLAIDLSDFPLSIDYLEDTNNYDIIGNYHIFSVDQLDQLNDSQKNDILTLSSKDFAKERFRPTHVIRLWTNKLQTTQLKLNLKKSIPSWIINSHTDSDIPHPDEMTTFGFKYLMSIFTDAYGDKSLNPTNNYFEIKINVNL